MPDFYQNGPVTTLHDLRSIDLEPLESLLREGPSFSTVESVEREAIALRGDSGFHLR